VSEGARSLQEGGRHWIAGWAEREEFKSALQVAPPPAIPPPSLVGALAHHLSDCVGVGPII
jgi:hypothetical protein